MNQDQLPPKDVELAVKMMLDSMTKALTNNQRIEIRGFGSFCLHYRAPRIGRNPKSGTTVELPGKYVPHFKPGKELRERVDYDRDDNDKPVIPPDVAQPTTSA